MTGCDYIRAYYAVPAEIGLQITYKGEAGVIAADGGHYVRVLLDRDKPGAFFNVHPADAHLVYGDKIVAIRKMTRSQQRYADYKNDDGFDGSFSEWLGIRRSC